MCCYILYALLGVWDIYYIQYNCSWIKDRSGEVKFIYSALYHGYSLKRACLRFIPTRVMQGHVSVRRHYRLASLQIYCCLPDSVSYPRLATATLCPHSFSSSLSPSTFYSSLSPSSPLFYLLVLLPVSLLLLLLLIC